MLSTSFNSPIPLGDIEAVLAWVDTFKLSRPTKKINRDFSDAVLLAEILSVHYPKLVEMHNYPPRNSHALKLNNWMTLNRKVLKKLKLNLCCNTMEQLANSAPGIIERVLVMVREKIQRDEEANKTMKESEQNLSSGGSYYEACGDDERVLVVPVKTRVNGVLETIQQKVVSHQSYLTLKEELKDAKDSTEMLKQKVEHLDNLLKLKEERIDELQKQLERKQSRRKEVEAMQNSINMAVQLDSNVPPPSKLNEILMKAPSRTPSIKSAESNSKIPVREEMKATSNEIHETVISTASVTKIKTTEALEDDHCELDRIKSDVFKEIEIVEDNNLVVCQETEEFKDTEPGILTTIEDAIQKELKDIVNPIPRDINYIN